MRDFKGKVAVVTGAASGIGLGLARGLAGEGASVVLADVEEPALEVARKDFEAAGTPVLAVRTDVSRLADVENLRDRALERFGRVDVLCNNAGVCSFNRIADLPLEDWRWVVDVDLWGVIYGVHVFLPVLLGQKSEAHIVNTASLAGVLSSTPVIAPYGVAKAGVVSISESLRSELAELGAPIGVTVLCPAHVRAQGWQADRNRPGGPEPRTAVGEAWRRVGAEQARGPSALKPEEFARRVLAAVREGRFWVFTDPSMKPMLERRFAEILGSYPDA